MDYYDDPYEDKFLFTLFKRELMSTLKTLWFEKDNFP